MVKKLCVLLFFLVTHFSAAFFGAFTTLKLNPFDHVVIYVKTPLDQKEEDKHYYPLAKKEKIYTGVVLPPNLVTDDNEKNLLIAKRFLSPDSNWSHVLSGEILNGTGFGFESSEPSYERNRLVKK